MAVVAFQRSGDAAIAKVKYDGKFVDQSECYFLGLVDSDFDQL